MVSPVATAMRSCGFLILLVVHVFFSGGWILLAGEPMPPYQPDYFSDIEWTTVAFIALWIASVPAIGASIFLPGLRPVALRIGTFGGLLGMNLLFAQRIVTVFLLNGLLSGAACHFPVYCHLLPHLPVFFWASFLWLAGGILQGAVQLMRTLDQHKRPGVQSTSRSHDPGCP